MKLEKSWAVRLREESTKPYFQNLKLFLESERQAGVVVYPPEPLIFQAFLKTPFEAVKVVIVGQDPYHGHGQAHGLSFSVPPGTPLPPSLKNIFKELVADMGVPYPTEGCLNSWAEQGVLMLNATLTVRAGAPKSHHGQGWERFTDVVIQKLVEREEPLIFILWGKLAQEKYHALIADKKHPHAVLMSAHPSPYSATQFFGCRHFSKANSFLIQWGKAPIHW